MSLQVRVREGLKLYPVRLLTAGGARQPTSAGGQRTGREKKVFEAVWPGLPATQLVETKTTGQSPEVGWSWWHTLLITALKRAEASKSEFIGQPGLHCEFKSC